MLYEKESSKCVNYKKGKKKYITDVQIHEQRNGIPSHLQCTGSFFSNVLVLLRPTPKTCARTACPVILPPHHRVFLLFVSSFFFFSLSFTWSSTVFVTCFAFSFLLQPNRLRHMNQRRLMLCSRNFCFQTSSHQSSTSSSSSLSSLCFDLCTASSSAVSSFHNSSSLSLSLFTNVTKEMANNVRDLFFFTELKNLFFFVHLSLLTIGEYYNKLYEWTGDPIERHV